MTHQQFLVVFAVSSMSAAALAQDTAPPAPAPTAAAPSACELGENIGVDPSDALVASRLICGDVLAQARAAGKVPPASYRVNFGRLGGRILMQVAEYGDGTRLSDERHLELNAIEDVSSVSARVAESLISKRPLAELENTGNVLPGEELNQRRKKGKMHVEAGLVGVAQVGSQDATPVPGIQLALTYELKRTYLTTSFRAAGGDAGSLVDLGIGGGTFLSDADIAPFVGGGVSWMGTSAHYDERNQATGYTTNANASGSGFAPYLEAGVGIFRTAKTGLRVGLRASVPTYKLKDATTFTTGSSVNGVWTYDSKEVSYDTYAVPLAMSVTMSF